METPADWPFADPPNVATITTRPVMDGTSWIALVSHDEDDGGWQFIGPEGPLEDQAMIVGLRSILAGDASIAELADLPLGWQAWRSAPHAACRMAPCAEGLGRWQHVQSRDGWVERPRTLEKLL